ncbi:MAG TPA: extracellular solute-binding protein [Thermomicrobiales bacterium]|nr:extracellular solute-binding protein [Thermomicrobiales bacterium]
MAQVTRRRFVGSAAAAGFATVLAGRSAGAASSRWSSPAIIRAQNAPVEIVFSNIWGTPPGGDAPTNEHPVEQVIRAFNEQNDTIKVIGRTDSGDYYEGLQKIQAELAAGSPSALVITPWNSLHFADQGLGITNLEDVAGDEVAEVFSVVKEQVVPLVQVDGKTKGVPYAFSTPVIYYNADVFKDAGVDPDVMFSTWEAFAQEAPKVQEALGGNPVFTFLGDSQWTAQSIIQCNGGFVMSDDGEPLMDSAEAIAAMQTIADLDKAGLYDSSTPKESRASFEGGSTACFIGSIASLGGFQKSVQFDIQTASFPTFGDTPRKMSSGGSFIGMYAREEEQQQAAWEFLKFCLSEEGYSIWMQTGYLNATNYDLPMIDGQEPAYEQLEEGLTRETPWPGSRGVELRTIWQDYVSRMWANDISAEDGCKQAAEEINMTK